MFNVKQFKMNKFIKYIWQLIIRTSNATLEVPSLRPYLYGKNIIILYNYGTNFYQVTKSSINFST